MNRIVYAGVTDNLPDKKNRCFGIYLPESGGKIITDGKEVEFSAGDIVAVPAFSKCAYEGLSGFAVLMEQAFLPVSGVTVFHDDKNGGIRHAAMQAALYFESELSKKDLILTALGGLIAGYVSAFCANEKFSPVVETVLAEIARNLSDGTFALDEAIKKLPLNYDYVRKLFKKEVGATPHEYLVAKRMERAASLLKSGVANRYSNYTVSQVAEACGFAEPLYFSRVFKKYFGVAPSEYAR